MSLGKKGQASIELILLLAIVLLLVQTIILPSFEVAQKSSGDVSSMAIVRNQAQKLANAIELVGSSNSGAKQTIHLVIPAHAKIGCNDAAFDPLFPQNRAIFYQIQPDSGIGVPEVCKHDADFVALPATGNNEKLCTGLIPLYLSGGTGFDCGPFSNSESPTGIIQRFDDNSSVFLTVQILNSANDVSLYVE